MVKKLELFYGFGMNDREKYDNVIETISKVEGDLICIVFCSKYGSGIELCTYQESSILLDNYVRVNQDVDITVTSGNDLKITVTSLANGYSCDYYFRRWKKDVSDEHKQFASLKWEDGRIDLDALSDVDRNNMWLHFNTDDFLNDNWDNYTETIGDEVIALFEKRSK